MGAAGSGQRAAGSGQRAAGSGQRADSTANWKNRTIWTKDNLHVLRGLNSNTVDLIYLDPPFNSNRTYEAPIGSEAAGAAFKDAWTFDDADRVYLALLKERDPTTFAIIEAARLAHGKGMAAYLGMMAQRLVEMRRVLKPTGSIYLHCDPTASHYLKLLMDGVFEPRQFRNEIIWKRNSSHNDSKGFGRVSDSILFYGNAIHSDAVRVPLDPTYREKFYRYEDERGRYRAGDLTAKGLSGGGYHYEFDGHTGPWRFPQARMLELDEQDRIHRPKKRGGVPSLKRYLHENKGQIPPSVWTDIPPVQPRSKERVGYPTQKPLTLLSRIIKASSEECGIVLDPFCGCATAAVAAERLQRQWIGIDISPKAAELVQTRLTGVLDEVPLYKDGDVIPRTDQPHRTDLGDLPPYTAHKDLLFGRQDGHCGGCGVDFRKRNLTVDHIVPRKHGGTDHLENLWLLCGACNSSKGTRSQGEFLKDRMKQRVELFPWLVN